MSSTRARTAEALEKVRIERQRQDDKWGEQRHGMGVWSLVLGEEVGEASEAVLTMRSLPAEAALQRHNQLFALRKELVQVAAVAVAWLEHVEEAIAEGRGMPEEVWQ